MTQAPTPGPLTAGTPAIRAAIALFRSAIKAGEAWSEDCAIAYRGALTELDELAVYQAPTAPVEASGSERDYTLRDHFLAMQAMATAYLMPEDYRDRDGRVTLQGDNNNTEFWKAAQAGARAQAFANDMIYMLDGPEERAALAAEHGNDAAFLEAAMAGFSLARNRRPQPSGETRALLERIAAVRARKDFTPQQANAGLLTVLDDCAAALSTTPARAEAQDEGAAGEVPEGMMTIADELEDKADELDQLDARGQVWGLEDVSDLMRRARNALRAHPSPTPVADADSVRIAVRESEWRDAIALILPLAKGYAAANRVGSNQSYVDHAEALLATPECPDADKLRPIIDEATHAVLPPVDDVTGFGTQARAAMQVEIADRIVAALKSEGK